MAISGKTSVEDTDGNIRSLPRLRRKTQSAGVSKPKGSKIQLQVSEEDILSALTSGKLVAYINELLDSEQSRMFEAYREEAKRQMEEDAETIAELQRSLQQKQERIDALHAQLQQAERQLELQLLRVEQLLEQQAGRGELTTPKRGYSQKYELPIRKRSPLLLMSQDELQDELKTIGFTMDMLELLTGVRITNYEEDDEKFYFDVKQASTLANDAVPTEVRYRLIIQRSFDQGAEVNYQPEFDDDSERLMAHLPAYLKENLMFPYNTLLQFYGKMNKALNKATRS